MNHRIRTLGIALLVAAAADARAVDGATAPYNEAVSIVDGKRVVDMAPIPEALKASIAHGRTPEQIGQEIPVLIEVETPMGLMDCADLPYYSPKICSATSFGKVKLERQWAVKLGGRWQLCVGRLKPVQCIPIVRDGVLRFLPMSPRE